MNWTYKEIIIDSILFLALIISLITDIKTRKILNIVTYPTILLGIALNSVFYYQNMAGLKFSLIGFAVGIVLFGIMFILGGLGMGDVKLMGAVGALKGGFFVLQSIVYIGIVGGILTIFFLIWKGTFAQTVKNMFYMVSSPFSKSSKEQVKKMPKIYLPYGPAIVIGILLLYISLIFKVAIV
jgi:prepilin peptidase CpaA